MIFEPDLSRVNKILQSNDLGYIYDFFHRLKEYLQNHPEHINKFDKV